MGTNAPQDRRPNNADLAIDDLWVKRQEFEGRISGLESLVDSQKTTQQILDAIPKKSRTSFEFLHPIEYDDTRHTVRLNKKWFSGIIYGSGTENYVPKFSDESTLTSSLIYDDGTGVAIGTETTTGLFTVYNDAVITDDYSGIYNEHVKTAGVGNGDFANGIRSLISYDQTGGTMGFLRGIHITAILADGDIGHAGLGGRDFQGAYVVGAQDGGVIRRNVYAGRFTTDLNDGTVDVDAFGLRSDIDQQGAHTITGNAYVNYLWGDFDGVVTGTSYMLYLNEFTGVDYGIYQNGTADNFLGGDTGIGIDSPANALHVYLNDASDASVANGSMLILEQDGAGSVGVQYELTGNMVISRYLLDNGDGSFAYVFKNITTGEIPYRIDLPGGDKVFGINPDADGYNLSVLSDAGLSLLVTDVVSGECQFGDTDNGNAIFESDGMLVFYNSATVWNDIQFSLSTAKVPAANAPTWATFTANTKKYTFDINDFVDLEANEVSHSYKEGSNADWHVHIYTNGLDGTDRTIKYELTYMIVNIDAIASETTVSSQVTIPANTPDLTHFSFYISEIIGTGIKINADITLRFKRIATDSGSDPDNDPFVSMIGMHIEEDTMGSRNENTK